MKNTRGILILATLSFSALAAHEVYASSVTCSSSSGLCSVLSSRGQVEVEVRSFVDNEDLDVDVYDGRLLIKQATIERSFVETGDPMWITFGDEFDEATCKIGNCPDVTCTDHTCAANASGCIAQNAEGETTQKKKCPDANS